jgi:SOS response regulatory protein OraA/RecX
MDLPLARKVAFRLLAMRSYHSEKLREKLEKRGCPFAVCDAVIAECKRLGYLQDEQYEESAILREFQRGHGPWYIEAKTRYSRQKIRKLITPEMQMERMRQLLPKLGPREKAMRALQRRGFDLELIRTLSGRESEGRG